MSERTNGGRSHRVNATGNLQQSMRANYGKHGVEHYYKQVGASYRNPHFPGVRACMFTWMERWWAHEKRAIDSRSPLFFDMACGAGEVTAAAYEWWKCGVSRTQPIKKAVASQGRHTLSAKTNGLERDSSTPTIRQVPDDLLIAAADPYTQAAYAERTTLPCAPLTFREISEGLLPPMVSTATSVGTSRASNADTPIDRIDMVVCSFALHLVESSSELFALLHELSTKAVWLVVLAPHKKPEIKEGWGWVKWDSECWSECGMNDRREFILERVHCRVYRSINVPDAGSDVAERGE
ncbi:hypothetical protein HD554DRAFT_2099826 [Boletus coccyginus]|nr:hypothetical protein HD554DRAFT_2099826 [Boletus coccyginus]